MTPTGIKQFHEKIKINKFTEQTIEWLFPGINVTSYFVILYGRNVSVENIKTKFMAYA